MSVCGVDQMMQVGDPGSSSTFAKSVSLFHKVVILHERSKSGTRVQTPKVKHAYLRETCLSACGKSLIIQLCLLHVFLTSTRKIHSFSRAGIGSRVKFTRVTMCTENCFHVYNCFSHKNTNQIHAFNSCAFFHLPKHYSNSVGIFK